MCEILKMLQCAREHKVSDIHIKNNVVYFRILDSLIQQDIDGKDIALYFKDIKNDESMAFEIEGCRIRCSFYESIDGKNIAIRLLQNEIPSFTSLKLPKIIEKIAMCRHGLILVCGATSSGKSSTIASILHFINLHSSKHIITLESPIEFVHKNISSIISQREIALHTKDFKSALSSSLRQDPDIIMIGEILDSKTLVNALNLALSGHLVISSFHANSCASAISRIISMSKKDNSINAKLAECLRAVISQKLLIINNERVLDCEIMLDTPAIKNLIKDNKINQIDSQITMSKECGMQNFKYANI